MTDENLLSQEIIRLKGIINAGLNMLDNEVLNDANKGDLIDLLMASKESKSFIEVPYFIGRRDVQEENFLTAVGPVTFNKLQSDFSQLMLTFEITRLDFRVRLVKINDHVLDKPITLSKIR